MWNKIKPYAISIAIALAVGGLSALLTCGNMDVYNAINRPALAPPMIVFPIVRGILFVLMGISAAIVYTGRDEKPGEAADALKVYVFQLIVNFFWSLIFFNMQAYLFAFIWLVLLWILIIIMLVRFAKISKVAAYLQLPYLIWVSFAGYLTFMIWLLNR